MRLAALPVLALPLLSPGGAACASSQAAERAPAGDAAPEAVREGPVAPPWEELTPEAFARARAEGRLILVSVYTQWCHWCHVMDEKTWEDPRVAALLQDRFVALRVDADARPDVADRYREWAWPATAVLTPDAEPVLHIKGYRSPEKVLAAFSAIVRDLDAGRPIALREVPPEAPIEDADLKKLAARVTSQMDAYWDEEQAGWGGPKKFPLLAPLELALLRAQRDGDADQLQKVKRTLARQRALADPVWGGMYQYSTYGIWTKPHFEKLAFIQAWALRAYAAGYAAFGDEELLRVAYDVRRYLNEHLRGDDGAYGANQDADVGTRGDRPHLSGAAFYALDDEARREAGEPFVDRRVFAFHNGVLIAGLTRLYEATLDGAVLADALRAAERVLRSHRRDDGLFLHAEGDDPRLVHLADQRGMAEALLALYEVTGDARWRDELVRLSDGTLAELRGDDGSLLAHSPLPGAVGVFRDREAPLRDNSVFARVLVRLSHHTGEARFKDAAEGVVRALARPAWLKDQRRLVGDYALAVRALLDEPVHLTVVGAPGDAGAAALFRAALPVHAPGRVLERQAPGEKFPDLGEAALYVCTTSFCSPPITDAAVVPEKVARYVAP